MPQETPSVVHKHSVEALSPSETLCDPLETWVTKLPASGLSPQTTLRPPNPYSLEMPHLPPGVHAESNRWRRLRASDYTLVAVCAYCESQGKLRQRECKAVAKPKEVTFTSSFV